jgi:hypothetical protein
MGNSPEVRPAHNPALRDPDFKENGRYFILGRTISPPAKLRA